jgi:hypothetical protein
MVVKRKLTRRPTKKFRFAGSMRVTSALRSAASPYNHDMLKPRLFSTLRCLQHENPLVRVVEDVDSAIADVAGSPALWRTATNAADAAGTTPKEEHQWCGKSDCCIICKGRCWEEYDCGYALRYIRPSNTKTLSHSCSKSCIKLCATRLQGRHS